MWGGMVVLERKPSSVKRLVENFFYFYNTNWKFYSKTPLQDVQVHMLEIIF